MNRKLAIIIGLQAFLIVMLFWVLVFYGKDEYEASTHRSDDKIEAPRFYFVHSYHLQCLDDTNISATANYGYEFPASVARENIMGVQFHPEKSHSYGMKLYSNFVNNY